jgi:acyl CoA:acetate/3-ketoacid CoA transferase alpha subunit
MTTLNKNYQTINGAVDKVSDIDARHNTAMTEIEADMSTIETALNDQQGELDSKQDKVNYDTDFKAFLLLN